MATIDLGKIKIVWRGTYAGGTAYTPDDAVVHSGTSYICIANTTGNTPPNATYWNVLAQGGTDLSATLTTQGDILYRDGSGLQRLAKGTAGTVLKMNSSANAPEWGTGGGLIQTVSTTLVTPSSYSLDNSFTDITGFNATITPTSSSNKVLVTATINYGTTTAYPPVFRLYRTVSGGSPTLIGAGTAAGNRPAANTAPQGQGLNGDKNRAMHASINFLDTPNTTSQTVYKINGGILQSSGVLQLNTSGTSYDTDQNYIARTSSTITVQEVV